MKEQLKDGDVRVAQAYRRLLALLADNTSLERVAMTAAGLACEILGAEGASVTRVEGTEAVYVAAVGTAAHLIYRRLRLQESFTGSVVESRSPLLFDPRRVSAESAARARVDAIRSGMVCPIMVEGEVLGTIGVTAATDATFDEHDLRRLREFADFLALTLQRNRDTERLERSYHFSRLGQLTGFIVQELSEPLATSLASMVRARQSLAHAQATQPSPELSTVGDELGISLAQLESIHRLLTDLRAFVVDEHEPIAAPQDPVPVVARVVEHLEARVARFAEFDVQVEPVLPHVRMVSGRIWQILYNLLINGIEAIAERPRGHHVLRLRLAGKGDGLQIIVEDSGVGIDPSAQRFVFEPFYTTKNATRRAGLGLTLVWQYVHAVGGSIELKSSPGVGSTFDLWLPAERME
jgi:signal transduction histidine kinase